MTTIELSGGPQDGMLSRVDFEMADSTYMRLRPKGCRGFTTQPSE